MAGLSVVARRGHGQKKAGVDFRETSLALLLMFQLANQFLSKSLFSLLFKKILAIFFLAPLVLLLIFFILPVTSESCHSHFKAASVKVAGVREVF